MRYLWATKSNGKMIEVIRKMKDSHIEPTWDECKNEGWTKTEYDNREEWIKIITGGSFTKTWNQKGRW